MACMFLGQVILLFTARLYSFAFCDLTGILVPLTILKAGVLEAKRRLSVKMVLMPLCPT